MLKNEKGNETNVLKDEQWSKNKPHYLRGEVSGAEASNLFQKV